MEDSPPDRQQDAATPLPRGLYIGDNGQATLRQGDIDMAFSQTDPDDHGGLCWSLSHFHAPGSGRELEVGGSRGTDYVFTQIPLAGGFEAEMTCGTRVTGARAGLISPGAPLMHFRFHASENRGFGVEASLDAVERWFGKDVPPAIRAMLDNAGRGSFHQPVALPDYLLQTLKAALANTRPLRDRLVESAALLVLSHQLEVQAEEGALAGTVPAEIRAAHEAQALMEAAGAQPPGPAALAAMLGLPVRRLAQAYREVYGQSLLQGAEQLRLVRAQDALLEGQAIKTIAADLGYSSVSNFTSAFRRRTGLPPRRWRELQARGAR
ncbi:AraC family transcriptional regulator [Oceanicola sp. S124]|uniref:AraC family transcriptional regulator n=1 Tax=Oceanicola sp. S124 TaxID=1042378 RepID=UPI0002558248|nr:AraC family transcriptional regulator [Oceanicola sp. S124]